MCSLTRDWVQWKWEQRLYSLLLRVGSKGQHHLEFVKMQIPRYHPGPAELETGGGAQQSVF